MMKPRLAAHDSGGRCVTVGPKSGGVVVAAVAQPGDDHTHGRPLPLHDAGLHGRCVGAQQHVPRILFQIEGIPHIARRVVGGYVE